MESKTVSASGAFVFWTLASWSSQKQLAERFKDLGIEGYAPRPMAHSTALFEATKEVCAKCDTFIRQMKNPGSFAVVRETKTDQGNLYATERTVRLEEKDGKITILFNPFDDTAQKILDTFNSYLGYVPGTSIGTGLVALIKKYHGTTVRKTGGLYWLPDPSNWKGVAEAVEASAVQGQSRMYVASLEVNADSIRVVRDAIEAEIVQESQRLLAEISTGELGENALKNRCAYLEEMQRKIVEYEAILGESLSGLKEAVDKVQVATGMGAFLQLNADQPAA